MSSVIRALASLRLTVTLLALSMVLIFVGTIAQTRLGVWQAVEAYFRSPVAWIDPGLFMPPEVAAGKSLPPVPFPGGLTLTVLLIVNLLSAHVARFKATRRRVGVLVLHAGLIVLLVGEIVTGFFSDEGLMSIDEGTSSSVIEDIREAELAIIDPSDPEADRVVVVPGAKLARASREGRTISDPRLPFDVVVRSWMPNSELFVADGGTPANRGVGLRARAEERPRVAGVEGNRTDMPACYVTLLTKGDEPEEVGTWMVSASLIDAQRVEHGEETFGLALRFRRTYLPYTLHLHEFRHDTFTGTTIPKNFSSDIRLVDPERSTDREVRIWMNNPLRYAGRTFYQASYKPDGSGTVLQVVENPGWLLPYAACTLVGGGMTWHFARSLTAFLRRRVATGPVRVDNPAPPPETRRRRWPALVAIGGVVLAISPALRPVPSGAFDTEAFGHIPVSAGGRVKPIDTAARAMLMVSSGRQQVRTEEGVVSATQFMVDLIARPREVAGLPALRVDHPDLLSLLGLAPEEGGRVSLAAIEPGWAGVVEQARRAESVPSRQRDGFQRAVLELYQRVDTLLAHAQMRQPFAVAPLGPEGEWRPFREAFLDGEATGEPHPSVTYLATMMSAASEDDAEGFNDAVHGYLALLEESMPGVMRKGRLEVLFNRTAPFSGATAVYLLAFLGVCASFLLRPRPGGQRLAEGLRVGALALVVGAVVVHTVAIAARIYLQGRPPVTNLYSSAIFVGWAAALVGIFIERIYPLGVAALSAAVVGGSTLIVAHNLGNDGDTMEMMQAVLDSNFWLATHVITITLGYSATFLAGAIASVYLLARAFTRTMTKAREQAISRMIYGVVCFALLLSFVGTVLGGIWADQSWGRFWGWDPKENGAALVVLLNAIILHARWGGFIRTPGIAVLAVAGNIVTAWSWFGTNMLGVGLHAYGFMDSASFWLALFVTTQLLIMSLGWSGGRPPSAPGRPAG